MSKEEILNLLPGDYIFREGEFGQHAYIINSGTVELVKFTGDQQSVLAELEKGALFGEMAIIDGSARSASARAKTECVLKVVSEEQLKKHLSSSPTASLDMMRRLASYVRNANERLNRDAFAEVPFYSQRHFRSGPARDHPLVANGPLANRSLRSLGRHAVLTQDGPFEGEPCQHQYHTQVRPHARAVHLRPRGLVLVQRRGEEAERLRRHEELVVEARHAVAPRRAPLVDVSTKIPPRVDGEGRQRPQCAHQPSRPSGSAFQAPSAWRA